MIGRTDVLDCQHAIDSIMTPSFSRYILQPCARTTPYDPTGYGRCRTIPTFNRGKIAPIHGSGGPDSHVCLFNAYSPSRLRPPLERITKCAPKKSGTVGNGGAAGSRQKIGLNGFNENVRWRRLVQDPVPLTPAVRWPFRSRYRCFVQQG